MTQIAEHEYRPEGSDNTPRRMCAVCSCGWSGPVVSGQDKEAQDYCRITWRMHINELKREGKL